VSVEDRLRTLAAEHRLHAGAVEALRRLLSALSDPAAPTAVHDPEEAVDVHVADSLAVLDVDDLRTARSIADLGAGAGPPGLVLAVALPQARVVLVESVARKCAFLEAAAQDLGLGNVEVVCARAESWSDGIGRCDVVCARALASLSVLCEYAAPLLRDRGVLVAWKGEVSSEEESAGLAAAATLGLEREAVRDVQPYPGSQRRTLHVFRKVRATPAGYPRRPGMAVKRPLGRGR
jgi:16S rRNA (guanine527-N7)-methyltransferase